MSRLRRPTNSSSTIRQTTSELNRNPSSPSHDRPWILSQKIRCSTLTQKLDQHHRAETDGVHYLSRRAREGFDMPNPSVRQKEFPFKSRIALPKSIQPLPVRRAPERSPEPPRTADFHSPVPEALFPRIFVASEPDGAACEVDLLQDEEFPEAETDVTDQPPNLANYVLHPRNRLP